MRKIEKIIIHCADTPPSMDIGADEIYNWHVNENGWSDIGYHYVIRRNGDVEGGRPLEQAGAHVRGHNGDSIGVCLVGGRHKDGGSDANFTYKQWNALEALVKQLLKDFPNAEVFGHRHFDNNKDCPCFDAEAWCDDLS